MSISTSFLISIHGLAHPRIQTCCSTETGPEKFKNLNYYGTKYNGIFNLLNLENIRLVSRTLFIVLLVRFLCLDKSKSVATQLYIFVLTRKGALIKIYKYFKSFYQTRNLLIGLNNFQQIKCLNPASAIKTTMSKPQHSSVFKQISVVICCFVKSYGKISIEVFMFC